MPFAESSIDVVLSDLPQGRKYGSVESVKTMYPGICKEIARVLRPGTGRGVLLTGQDCSEALAGAIASTKGLELAHRLTFEFGRTSSNSTDSSSSSSSTSANIIADQHPKNKRANQHAGGKKGKKCNHLNEHEEGNVLANNDNGAIGGHQAHICTLFCVTSSPILDDVNDNEGQNPQAAFNLDPGGFGQEGKGGGRGGEQDLKSLCWNSDKVNTRSEILDLWRKANPPLELLSLRPQPQIWRGNEPRDQ